MCWDYFIVAQATIYGAFSYVRDHVFGDWYLIRFFGFVAAYCYDGMLSFSGR